MYLEDYTKYKNFIAEHRYTGEPGRNLEIASSYAYAVYLEEYNERFLDKKVFYEGIFPKKNKEDMDAYMVNKKPGMAYDRVRIQFTCNNRPKTKCKAMANLNKNIVVLYGRDDEHHTPKGLSQQVKFVNIFSILKELDKFKKEDPSNPRFLFLDYLFEKCLNLRDGKYSKLCYIAVAKKKAELYWK